MSDSYTFGGIPFLLLMPANGETPHWAVKIDATDRALIGTDRFEHSIRWRQFSLTCELWVEPTDDPATAQAHWEALQTAYGAGTVAALVSPAGTTFPALIAAFEVGPVRGGLGGYRGKAVFGRPLG